MTNLVGRLFSLLIVCIMGYLYIKKIFSGNEINNHLFPIVTIVVFTCLFIFLKKYKESYKNNQRLFDYIGSGTPEEEKLLFNNWYMRAVWSKGVVREVPIACAIIYFIPWSWLYQFSIYRDFIDVMSVISPNIIEYRNYSDFPEWSQSFVACINAIMPLTLIFAFTHSNPLPGYVSGRLPFSKWVNLNTGLCGIVTAMVFMIFIYKISGYDQFKNIGIDYISKLSLVITLVFCWWAMHFFMMGAISSFKTFIIRHTSDKEN